MSLYLSISRRISVCCCFHWFFCVSSQILQERGSRMWRDRRSRAKQKQNNIFSPMSLSHSPPSSSPFSSSASSTNLLLPSGVPFHSGGSLMPPAPPVLQHHLASHFLSSTAGCGTLQGEFKSDLQVSGFSHCSSLMVSIAVVQATVLIVQPLVTVSGWSSYTSSFLSSSPLTGQDTSLLFYIWLGHKSPQDSQRT